jgi:predicted outer membrane protein
MTVRSQRWWAAALAGFAAGALMVPTPAPAAPPGLTALTATDVMLLNGVRLAGLWEIPAGQMAAQKGRLARVREIGAMIADQHVELDQLVVDAANRLGVEIPDQPNADQKQWLREMQNASGARFDRIFVDRLRAAHGKIFPVIGAVRTGTRNDVIRDLAIAANTFVGNHLSMLESTGLVRYVELPPAAVPPPQDDSLLAKAQANSGIGINPVLAWIVLLVALAVTGTTGTWVLRRHVVAATRNRSSRSAYERRPTS